MKQIEQHKLIKRLGYDFQNIKLFEEALTHASANSDYNNEHLEFLGDRVLGLVIADYLRLAYPKEAEGKWAKRLAVLTSRVVCAEVAQKYNMQAALIADKRNWQNMPSHNVMANLCEAVIAAIYLDGGLLCAQNFIFKAWHDIFENQPEVPISDKEALQEFALANGLGLPRYKKISQTGPDHKPEITVLVSLSDNLSAKASESSKKQAEHKAAQALLEALKN